MASGLAHMLVHVWYDKSPSESLPALAEDLRLRFDIWVVDGSASASDSDSTGLFLLVVRGRDAVGLAPALSHGSVLAMPARIE